VVVLVVLVVVLVFSFPLRSVKTQLWREAGQLSGDEYQTNRRWEVSRSICEETGVDGWRRNATLQISDSSRDRLDRLHRHAILGRNSPAVTGKTPAA